MKFFLSDLFEKNNKSHHDEHTVVVSVHESLHNITEGSEFLDDAIRMKEQPFVYSYTEEGLAAGNPKDL
jgi:hypothetical protein